MRTDNEEALAVEETRAALKNGGSAGDYDGLAEYEKQFFDESGGLAVNTGYFPLHPAAAGAFDKVAEGHDSRKHPYGSSAADLGKPNSDLKVFFWGAWRLYL
ncbi:MAG: hypothetical protein LBB48_01725 [Treponema sp.]|nr:hypothetical protein [Treponema sp.]